MNFLSLYHDPERWVNHVKRRAIELTLRTIYGNERGRKMLWWLRPDLLFVGYEPNVSRAIRGLHGNLALDIGASQGEHTLRLAYQFTRVIAIEPNPLNLPELIQLLSHPKLRNVRLVPCAIGEVDGKTELHINPQNVHGSAWVLGPGTSSECFPVSLMKLDTLLKDEKSVDLVMVDAEGSEWNVLKGSELSYPKIKRWMIEVHRVENHAMQFDLSERLRSHGYRTKWIDDPEGFPHIYATRDG